MPVAQKTAVELVFRRFEGEAKNFDVTRIPKIFLVSKIFFHPISAQGYENATFMSCFLDNAVKLARSAFGCEKYFSFANHNIKQSFRKSRQ